MKDRPNQAHLTAPIGSLPVADLPCAARAGAVAIPRDRDVIDALLAGVAAQGAAVALCDADDRLRYANADFRASFCPAYDEEAEPFVAVLTAAIRDGTGIRLVTADPETFAARVAARRRDQRGAISFPTDTTDGRWWWVTDSKLPSGWMLIVAQDISSLKHQEFALRDAHASALEDAETDDLTGAPNRRCGFRRAEAAVAAAHEVGRGLAVALMDIDHFKTINDRHGHDAGDGALRHFVRVLEGALGPDDRFCRLGGDEFLLVSTSADAAALERRLGEVFATMPALVLPGRREGLRLTVSTGVATLAPDEDWPALLRRADDALYAAKAAGRDRIARAA